MRESHLCACEICCLLRGRRRLFFFSSRRRHTRLQGDWSSDVCSSDLPKAIATLPAVAVWDAEVVEVKVAKVPRPAIPPATPSAASDRRIFSVTLLGRM